ncbi:four and a half LIM domains protein 1-like [Hydractinia symbiolongicarpus]|uniref:four and a half LIM domains protein 1-like n=1 Tax=Hydractinia symbiolongicarpus TaxID=13093 RepID=UPI002549CBD9|nr:four and a half LIM domains protein 1-like [Hydractinia symbiolongicarpus]
MHCDVLWMFVTSQHVHVNEKSFSCCITEVEAFQHHGQLFHDYFATSSKYCGKCDQALVNKGSSYITFEGVTYHPKCFACRKCKKPLHELNFYIVEEQKFCDECYY